MPSAPTSAMLAGDLGGTHLRLAVFDAAGQQLRHVRRDTPRDDPDALVGLVRATLAAAPGPVEAFVLGVPGPVSYDEGRPFRLPHLPAWEGRLTARSLADTLALPVLIANDADLAALGEHRFGAGVGTRDMLYVTASTGVGAGVILNGRLLHGRRSLAEIGWTTIDARTDEPLDALASGSALERITGQDGATVTRRALEGDPSALAALREVAHALAIGVTNAVFSFMPERVVIGGGLSQSSDIVLDVVRERLAREGSRVAIQPDVVIASCGDDVGLRGAFALWQDLQDGSPSLRYARPAAQTARAGSSGRGG